MYFIRDIIVRFLVEIFSSSVVMVDKEELKVLKEVCHESDDYIAVDKAMRELISTVKY